MLGLFGNVERMDETRWVRNVKVATVECHQGRGRPRFGWLDGRSGNIFTSQGGRLARGNATSEREKSVKRMCKVEIELKLSEKGRCVRVVGCLYWVSRQSHA